MTDHVVFDLEIQKNPESVPGGWEAKHLFGVAVGVLWEHRTGRMRVYGPDDLAALKGRLLTADRITGFNTEAFDLPVLFGAEWPTLAPQLMPKSDDLLARVWTALGRREKGWKANEVCQATVGVGKTGDGADAPGLFQAGQWGRLCDYCCCDVAIERDLGQFVDRYGYLIGGLPPRRLSLPEWKPTPKESR